MDGAGAGVAAGALTSGNTDAETEEVLAEMRVATPPICYLVGTPRARVRQTRSQWEALAWQKIKDTVEVKLFREGHPLILGIRVRRTLAVLFEDGLVSFEWNRPVR